MRILRGMLLTLFMTSCSGQNYNPEARIEIRASVEDRPKVINALKSFGQRNQFEVVTSDGMPNQGRFVSQVLLKRADGVMITMDNFAKPDVFEIFFYAKESDVDWESVKDAWLREISSQVGHRGDVVEVPVGPIR